MRTRNYRISRAPSLVLTALIVSTSFSPSTSSATEAATTPSTTVGLPTGRTVDGLRCFDLEAYKTIAIIYSRYLSCEAQKPLVAGIVEVTEDKQAALRAFADDLESTLTRAEAERSAYALAATYATEQAATEERRKRAWRVTAVVSLAAAVVLGAVVVGIGVSP